MDAGGNDHAARHDSDHADDDQFHDSHSQVGTQSDSSLAHASLPSQPSSPSSSASAHTRSMEQQQAELRRVQAHREISRPFPLNFWPPTSASASPLPTDQRPRSSASRKNAGSALIDNKPKTEEDEPDEEEDDELMDPEVRAVKLLKEVFYDSLYEIFVVIPAAFLPVLLVFVLCDFEAYDIFTVKGPSAALNPYMEAIRYNLFFIFAYLSHVLCSIAAVAIPELVVLVLGPSQVKAVRALRMHMRYFVEIRSQVTLCLWLWSLIYLGSSVLYRSSFIDPVQLLHEEGASRAAVLLAAKPAADRAALLDELGSDKYHQIFEAGLAVLAIFALFVALEKYIMSAITLNFHRSAFATRIADANQRFTAFSRLFEAITRNVPKLAGSGRSVLYDFDSSTQLTLDINLQLNSVHRAQSVARTIYRTLLDGKDRDWVEVGDLEPFVKNPEETYALINSGLNDKLTSDALENELVDLYTTRENLLRSLQANGRVMKKLDRIFKYVFYLLAAIVASPFMDVGLSKIWAVVSLSFGGFAFLFKDSAKTIYQSLLFVFVMHTFDVGDRVVIDNETYIIEDIEIYTTKLVRWDGVLVYVTNSTLAAKTIENIRRSENMCLKQPLTVKGTTPTNALWTFKERLTELVQKDRANYTGYVELDDMDKMAAGADKMTFSVVIQTRGNFQNPARQNQRKVDILAKMADALQAAGVESV